MNERFELRPGARAVGSDGGLGTVRELIVDCDRREVTGLVLHEGLLTGRVAVVPFAAVERADDGKVHIRLTIGELAALADGLSGDSEGRAGGDPANDSGSDRSAGPEAGRARSPRPSPSGTGVCRVMPRQPVMCRDGAVGPLALLLVDAATARIASLVVRHGGLLGRDTLVPAEWVREIADERIVLGVARDQLDTLPEYRRDVEITDAVRCLLWYASGLDPADLRYVEVRTRDGVVELRGKTSTEGARVAIEVLSRGVRGVLGVRNRLGSFEALAAASRSLSRRGESLERSGRAGAAPGATTASPSIRSHGRDPRPRRAVPGGRRARRPSAIVERLARAGSGYPPMQPPARQAVEIN